MKIKSYWNLIKNSAKKKYAEWQVEKKLKQIYEKKKHIQPFLNQTYLFSKKRFQSFQSLAKSKSIQIAHKTKIYGKEYSQKTHVFLKKTFIPYCRKTSTELEKEIDSFRNWLKKKLKTIYFCFKAIQITAKIVYYSLRFKKTVFPKLKFFIKTCFELGRKFLFQIWNFIVFILKTIVLSFLFLKKHLLKIFTELSEYLGKNYPQLKKTTKAKSKNFYHSTTKHLKSSAQKTHNFSGTVLKKTARFSQNFLKKTFYSSKGFLKKTYHFSALFLKKAISFFSRHCLRFFHAIKYCFLFILTLCFHFFKSIFRKIKKAFMFFALQLKNFLRFFSETRIFIKGLKLFAVFLSKNILSAFLKALNTAKTVKAGFASLKKLLLFLLNVVLFLRFNLVFLKNISLGILKNSSRKVLVFFKWFIPVFKILKISLFQVKKILSVLANFIKKLKNLNQFSYQKILSAVHFSCAVALFLKKLFVFKTFSFIRFQNFFARSRNIFHFNLNSFFKFHVFFLRLMVRTNWVKRGYQLAVFLIVSLTLFSFSRASFDWTNNEKPVLSHFAEIPQIQKEFKKDIKVYIDISDSALRKTALLHLKNFELVSSKKDADAIASQSISKDFVSVFAEGTAFVIHKNNSLQNLSPSQIQDIFSGKITEWSQIGGKAKKIQILTDPESLFKPQAGLNLNAADKIIRKAENEEDVLGVLAVKNLVPSAKVIMIDYRYPSKSEILLGHYPFSRFVALNFKDSVGIEKELVFQKISGETLRSVVAGGDMMWDRGVGGKIRQFGTDFLIKDLAPFFKTGDISVVNLETSVSQRGSRYNIDKGIFFRSDPRYINLLTDMSINLVSLANNHAFDYGMTAILDTVDYLNRHKIKQVGFGRDNDEARMGTIYEFGGKKIRFVAYNTVYPNNVLANSHQPGIMMINPSTIDNEIRQAKKGIDYLILLMHSGEEYSFYPESYKISLYRKLVDLGADIIVGSHPHVVQSFEFYKGKPIIYSVGNLLFDQYRFPNTREEIVMELNFYNGKLTYLFPHFFSVNSEYKPELVKNKEVEKLQARMAKLQTDIVRITRTSPKKDITGNVPLYNYQQNVPLEENKPPVKTDVQEAEKNPADEEKIEDSQYKQAEEKMPSLFSEEKSEN